MHFRNLVIAGSTFFKMMWQEPRMLPPSGYFAIIKKTDPLTLTFLRASLRLTPIRIIPVHFVHLSNTVWDRKVNLQLPFPGSLQRLTPTRGLTWSVL